MCRGAVREICTGRANDTFPPSRECSDGLKYNTYCVVSAASVYEYIVTAYARVVYVRPGVVFANHEFTCIEVIQEE